MKPISLLFASLLLAAVTLAQQPSSKTTKAHHSARAAAHATIWTNTQGEWQDVPVFPKGAQMKVISGNPKAGPSDLYVKFPAGYGVPFHWHTPVESVYEQAGSLELAMPHSTDTHTIAAGGFFRSPSHMVHKATCTSSEDCYFFLHSTGPFDIHLVAPAAAAKSNSAK